MNTTKWIPIRNINIPPKLPLNPSTTDLMLRIHNKEISIEDIPPITVEYINGGYVVKDGRHRYLAYKMLGIENIYAYIYQKKIA